MSFKNSFLQIQDFSSSLEPYYSDNNGTPPQSRSFLRVKSFHESIRSRPGTKSESGTPVPLTKVGTNQNSQLKSKSSLSLRDRLTSSSTLTPGHYELTLRFKGFRIKSDSKLYTSNEWLLSFYHPPLSIGPEEKSLLVGYPKIRGNLCFKSNNNNNNAGSWTEFQFPDDTEMWDLLISTVSSELLETPLKSFLYCPGAFLDFGADEPSITYAEFPVGTLFSMKANGNEKRSLSGSAPIFTVKKERHVGFLDFEFHLEKVGLKTGRVGATEGPPSGNSTPTLTTTSNPREIQNQSPSIMSALRLKVNQLLSL